MVNHFIFVILVALLPLFANLENSLYVDNINTINIIATSLFLLTHFIYGLYNGRSRVHNFISFNIMFWSINIGLIVIHQFTKVDFFNLIPACISLAPMYSLHFYFMLANIPSPLSYYLLIAVIAACSTLGYIMGLMFNNKKLES